MQPSEHLVVTTSEALVRRDKLTKPKDLNENERDYFISIKERLELLTIGNKRQQSTNT